MFKVQVVTNSAHDARWIEAKDNADLVRQMTKLGFIVSDKVGGGHLKEILRGKPKFTNIYGPMYGETADGEPAVRYEDQGSYDLLSR